MHQRDREARAEPLRDLGKETLYSLRKCLFFSFAVWFDSDDEKIYNMTRRVYKYEKNTYGNSFAHLLR